MNENNETDSHIRYSDPFFPFFSVLSYVTRCADRVHVLEDRSLVLENVDISDEGEYRCEADNLVGSISAVGSLVVQCMFHRVFLFFAFLI